MTVHFSYNIKIACYALDILSEVKDNLVKRFGPRLLLWTFVLHLCQGQAFQHINIHVARPGYIFTLGHLMACH